MKRVLAGLLALVVIAALITAFIGHLTPQDRVYSLAEVQRQRTTLAGHIVLAEAKAYMAGGAGKWSFLAAPASPSDLLHPPHGASALIVLIPPSINTASSALWAAPQVSPPLPRHSSVADVLHSFPIVGHLFTGPTGLFGLRHWRLVLLPHHGPVCGVFLLGSPNPPRPAKQL